MRAYCKNGFVVCTDPATAKSKQTALGSFLGRDVAVAEGTTTAGGIILLEDRVATSPTSHEAEVVSSATPDLTPGDRVVVYLGGDDGDIQASGISAFLPLNGQECFVVPDQFVWAKFKDGEIMPRRNVLLVHRDDEAMQKYAFNGSSIIAPDGLMQHGVAAANRENPENSGGRTRDSVTLQYARVVRTGPGVKDDALARGAVVAFSPSFSCTTLVRQIRQPDGKFTKQYLALVDSSEVFFVVHD